ncbi:hypothetical protein HMPREF1984_00630 [Leptotrichia sp. oral taxon 215 str. W9775]|nr:hypothetical protein HMPREF1984_00630 [Leptotrichia sp. oral taxon 215 str. W9775]
MCLYRKSRRQRTLFQEGLMPSFYMNYIFINFENCKKCIL